MAKSIITRVFVGSLIAIVGGLVLLAAGLLAAVLVVVPVDLVDKDR